MRAKRFFGAILIATAFVATSFARVSREHRILAVLLLSVLISYTALYKRGLATNTWPHGDGYYSWVYARSLAYDGDVDFTNDYKMCGDGAESKVVAATGRPSNYFYAGPALVWTPIVYALRKAITIPPAADEPVRAGCRGPVPILTGAVCILFSVATVWLTFRAARRVSGPFGAFFGALVTAFGSTLSHYGTTMWFYSHALSALGAALALVTWQRVREKPDEGARFFWAGASVGFAALMRPQEAIWGTLILCTLIAEAWRAKKNLAALAHVVWRGATVAFGFAIVFGAQLVIYKKIFGVYWLLPQGKLYLQPFHAHPFLLLFAGGTGFFSWTPLMWLGVFGLVMMLRDRKHRAIAAAISVVFFLAVWTSSSALSWSGANTFGARLLTSSAPAMGLGAAAFATRAARFLFARKWRVRAFVVLAVVVPFAIVTTGMSSKSGLMFTPFTDGFNANEESARATLGNPFSFPANEIFRLRYHVPPKDFDVLAVPGFFTHNFRSGILDGDDTIIFSALPAQGFIGVGPKSYTKEGLELSADHPARFLITLYWPWVTDIALTIIAEEAGELSIDVCSFFSCKPAFTTFVGRGGRNIEHAVDAGVFDSGINEVHIRTTSSMKLRGFRFIDNVKRESGIVGL